MTIVPSNIKQFEIIMSLNPTLLSKAVCFHIGVVQLNIPTVVMGNEEKRVSRETRSRAVWSDTDKKKKTLNQHIINITEQVYIQLKYKQ